MVIHHLWLGKFSILTASFIFISCGIWGSRCPVLSCDPTLISYQDTGLAWTLVKEHTLLHGYSLTHKLTKFCKGQKVSGAHLHSQHHASERFYGNAIAFQAKIPPVWVFRTTPSSLTGTVPFHWSYTAWVPHYSSNLSWIEAGFVAQLQVGCSINMICSKYP